jgi:DNA-binding transcriptional MerR regulator
MGRSTEDRSYLSIREVLQLLIEEFPDVTISKIRFLEARGLIHPERTPSGYRKFYAADVERLRWILRQQREHYLPLNVIKVRLDGGTTSDPRDVDAQSLFDTEAEAKILDDSTSPERARATTRRDSFLQDARDEVAPDDSKIKIKEVSSHRGHSDINVQHPSLTKNDSTTVTDEGLLEPLSNDASLQDEVVADLSVPTDDSPHASPLALGLGKGQVTIAELAARAAVDVAFVGECDNYGLITGRDLRGIRCYDEEAVVICRFAGQFAQFGIEPRHLKIFQHASEREAGLFAQVVTPLLHQRNPEARDKALANLAQLTKLGTALKGAFVKAELHDITGG